MKSILRHTKTCLFLITILLLTELSAAWAQNITSPYSVLGIGDVDTKDFGRYFGSGNASLARRDFNSYNFSNPASLTALPYKTMNFDIVTRGRSSGYTFPDADTAVGIPSNDFVVKRITMAFKAGKTTGLAVGLKPYSSVNYLYLQDNVILDGNTSYFKMVEGSGGINQFYFSFAKEINKQISIGATASWLFGSLERQTQYISPSVSLNITKKELDFYTGGMLQGGIQFYSLPGKKWRHQFGLMSSVNTNLHGELSTEYNDPGGSIKKDIEKGRSIKLPISAGFGYSVVKNEKLTLSVEGNYYNWKYRKVNYANSYIYPSFRFSGGVEYAFLKKVVGGKYEKGYVSGGLNFENSYLHIENNNLPDYSFSIGLGRNVSRFISLYTGLEAGKKGRKDYNQVTEKYTQFIIGLTLKDVWIGPRYSGRYD
jgi:hypothetical protein